MDSNIIAKKRLNIYPPLIISRDSYIQTESASKKNKNNPNFLIIDIICFIILAYISICVTVSQSALVQSILVYCHTIRLPFYNLTNLPSLGLENARNIEISISENIKIKGWHLIPPQSSLFIVNQSVNAREYEFEMRIRTDERIFLFFHGQGGNRAFRPRLNIIKLIASVFKAHVVTFDYRGFGDSSGWPSENGTLGDALGALEWIKQHIELPIESNISITKKQTPYVYIYGQSLGAAVALQLVSHLQGHDSSLKHMLSGLILDAPFASLAEASMSHPIALPFRLFLGMKEFM